MSHFKSFELSKKPSCLPNIWKRIFGKKSQTRSCNLAFVTNEKNIITQPGTTQPFYSFSQFEQTHTISLTEHISQFIENINKIENILHRKGSSQPDQTMNKKVSELLKDLDELIHHEKFVFSFDLILLAFNYLFIAREFLEMISKLN